MSPQQDSCKTFHSQAKAPGKFREETCVFLPVKFWMTPASDGSRELSRLIGIFSCRTFFFPSSSRGFCFAQSPHTAMHAVSNCMHCLLFTDFYRNYEKRDWRGRPAGKILSDFNTGYRSHPGSPLLIPQTL